MKKYKEKLGYKISRKLDFPVEAVVRTSSIEIKGTKDIEIYGCVSILKYDVDIIKLVLFDGVVTLFGENLEMVRFFGDNINVKGLVNKIEFGKVNDNN